MAFRFSARWFTWLLIISYIYRVRYLRIKYLPACQICKYYSSLASRQCRFQSADMPPTMRRIFGAKLEWYARHAVVYSLLLRADWMPWWAFSKYAYWAAYAFGRFACQIFWWRCIYHFTFQARRLAYYFGTRYLLYFYFQLLYCFRWFSSIPLRDISRAPASIALHWFHFARR